jgi:uncharacterized protein (TIGR00290 family)
MKVVSLWSGGKDSCFACYRAIQQGYKVASLFNFINVDGKKSLSHGLSAGLLRKQAELTGMPFLQKAMPKETYRAEFKRLINEWKKRAGIEGIVFGDIYLQEHRDWIDKVCQELEVSAIIPLWGKDTKGLIKEFVQAGFKAIVVAVNLQVLDKDWLGCQINKEFIEDLEERGDIDFCGENGEYHTFVYDGPLFKKAVNFRTRKKLSGDKYWFLEII